MHTQNNDLAKSTYARIALNKRRLGVKPAHENSTVSKDVINGKAGGKHVHVRAQHGERHM
jgi:hypothetical protein